MKFEQSDLSYLISAYIQNKGMPEIECYPEVYVTLGKVQEQVDVFARNWNNGTFAILECRLRENPKAPYETQVHIIREEAKNLEAKMRALNVSRGYIITNMIFESDDQEKRVLDDAVGNSSTKIRKGMTLLGKINGRSMISQLDIVLQGLKPKELSLSPRSARDRQASHEKKKRPL